MAIWKKASFQSACLLYRVLIYRANGWLAPCWSPASTFTATWNESNYYVVFEKTSSRPLRTPTFYLRRISPVLVIAWKWMWKSLYIILWYSSRCKNDLHKLSQNHPTYRRARIPRQNRHIVQLLLFLLLLIYHRCDLSSSIHISLSACKASLHFRWSRKLLSSFPWMCLFCPDFA